LTVIKAIDKFNDSDVIDETEHGFSSAEMVYMKEEDV
jgi:hypothetical protein